MPQIRKLIRPAGNSLRAIMPACLLGVLALLSAGCTAGGTGQGSAATPTLRVLPAATTSPVAATAQPISTVVSVPTPIGTPGTPTPRPVPSGTPPDPANVINIFNYVPSDYTLVKRDFLHLNKSSNAPEGEIVYTVTSPAQAITSETQSDISVLQYDTIYREWNPLWQSTYISGTASPLPSINVAGGMNGGDLLRTGSPILAVRTTTLDGRAHLGLWRWDSTAHKGSLLRMLPSGGAERDAIFDGDLDVNLADLNDDGTYEVVADNFSGVQVWKWDGARFVPEVAK